MFCDNNNDNNNVSCNLSVKNISKNSKLPLHYTVRSSLLFDKHMASNVLTNTYLHTIRSSEAIPIPVQTSSENSSVAFLYIRT